MTGKTTRAGRRVQQAREVEESQTGLRNSIAETKRLVGESEKMLQRHRKERVHDEGGGGEAD